MTVDSIKEPTSVMQGTQSMADTSAIVSESMMSVRIIGLMQGFCSLLIIVGLIVGIIYMKEKSIKQILIKLQEIFS